MKKIHALAFTEWQYSAQNCLKWFLWFLEKKVPAAIVQRGKEFAVFRQGKRKQIDKEYNIVIEDPPAMEVDDSYVVIISCNGFTWK